MELGTRAVEDMGLAARPFWRGRRVLVTGHTGFKGSWLSLWLRELGAEVAGFSLAPTSPSLYQQAQVQKGLRTTIADIRDEDALRACFKSFRPQTVFHLAAQPLVLRAFREPAETFAVNLQGTVNALDAARRDGEVEQFVAVTTDKVYENAQPEQPCREDDRLGGRDPYSSSKACAELAIASFRACYPEMAIASARAGNVLGGGDWAEDRILPDCARALSQDKPLVVRNPDSVRPWQHVLDPLAGYLLLAERLAESPKRFGGAWNFGPAAGDEITVEALVSAAFQAWGKPGFPVKRDGGEGGRESAALRLDSEKARRELGWRPVFDSRRAVVEAVSWYKAVLGGADARAACLSQLENYACETAHG